MHHLKYEEFLFVNTWGLLVIKAKEEKRNLGLGGWSKEEWMLVMNAHFRLVLPILREYVLSSCPLQLKLLKPKKKKTEAPDPGLQLSHVMDDGPLKILIF